MSLTDEIDDIAWQVHEAIEKSRKIWVGRTKFSVKHEDKLREKIRPLDQLIQRLYLKMWVRYLKLSEKKFDKILTEIKEYKNVFGKTRIIYCDGEFHFVVNKKMKLDYAFSCDCEV